MRNTVIAYFAKLNTSYWTALEHVEDSLKPGGALEEFGGEFGSLRIQPPLIAPVPRGSRNAPRGPGAMRGGCIRSPPKRLL